MGLIIYFPKINKILLTTNFMFETSELVIVCDYSDMLESTLTKKEQKYIQDCFFEGTIIGIL